MQKHPERVGAFAGLKREMKKHPERAWTPAGLKREMKKREMKKGRSPPGRKAKPLATTGQVVFSGVNGQGNVSIFQSPIRSWELPLTGGAWPTAGYRITHVQWAVGNVLMNQPKRECHVVLAGDAGQEIDAFKPYLLAYAAGSYYSLSRPGAALESEMKGKSSISLGFYSTKGDLSENTGNVFSIRGGCTLSLTVTYELLFQASPFSLDKSAMDMGRTVTVNVGATDVNGGFTHTATLTMGGQSVTASRTGPGAIQLTVPASWYGLLPTSVSGTATVTVTTAGAGQTGSASKPLTLTIPAGVKPTAGTLTAEGISPYWGLYVQGVSRARLTLSGYAAGAGASGVSVSIAGGGYSGAGASLTTGALKTAGDVTFTATVMDSRGRTATATVSLTVTAYNPPKITSLGVARCTADGTVDEAAGTYVKITLGYTWSAIGSNAIDGDIYIGGVKTQSNAALPASGEAFAAAFGGELAVAAAYPIKVMIYDGIHTRAAGASISAEAILQSVRRVLNFYPSADSGIGVGKMATGEKRVELASDWKLVAQDVTVNGTMMSGENDLRYAPCGTNHAAVDGSQSDANAIWRAGYYDLVNNGSIPGVNPNTWLWLINAAHRGDNQDYRYGMQLAGVDGSNLVYIRNRDETGGGPWYQLLHNGNMQIVRDWLAGQWFPIAVGAGGTGANNASDATYNLICTDAPNSLTQATDKPLNWPSGLSLSFFHPGNTSIYVPSVYGLCLSLRMGSECAQLWFTQAYGTVYHRQGNANGWSDMASATNYGWVALS